MFRKPLLIGVAFLEFVFASLTRASVPSASQSTPPTESTVILLDDAPPAPPASTFGFDSVEGNRFHFDVGLAYPIAFGSDVLLQPCRPDHRSGLKHHPSRQFQPVHAGDSVRVAGPVVGFHGYFTQRNSGGRLYRHQPGQCSAGWIKHDRVTKRQ